MHANSKARRLFALCALLGVFLPQTIVCTVPDLDDLFDDLDVHVDFYDPDCYGCDCGWWDDCDDDFFFDFWW